MVFTLESYAAIYAETHGFSFDHLILAKCLWGDMYYNVPWLAKHRRSYSEFTRMRVRRVQAEADERKFQKTPPDAEQPRSFVQPPACRERLQRQRAESSVAQRDRCFRGHLSEVRLGADLQNLRPLPRRGEGGPRADPGRGSESSTQCGSTPVWLRASSLQVGIYLHK